MSSKIGETTIKKPPEGGWMKKEKGEELFTLILTAYIFDLGNNIF